MVKLAQAILLHSLQSLCDVYHISLIFVFQELLTGRQSHLSESQETLTEVFQVFLSFYSIHANQSLNLDLFSL